jgi:cytochrome c556
MRTLLIAVSTVFTALGACSDPDAGQANNGQANTAQANVSNDQSGDGNLAAATLPKMTTPVSAEEAKKVMHERHEGMEAIGKANKAIKRELDGRSPDLAMVRTNAAKMNDLAQKSAHWFPAGTGPDVGKTGSKREIWAKPQDFTLKMTEFQNAARAFNSAAAGNDVAAMKSAFGDLGKSCKACHDPYRLEMKH